MGQRPLSLVNVLDLLTDCLEKMFLNDQLENYKFEFMQVSPVPHLGG